MPCSPLHRPSEWDTPVSLISSAKAVSEESRRTPSPSSPVNLVESFPGFVRKRFPSDTSHSRRTDPVSPPGCSQGERNKLLSHLSLLFLHVLPSVLLSIVCIALSEVASLLQRLANYLQSSNGSATELNLLGEDPASDGNITPRSPSLELYHHGSPRTPRLPNPRSQIYEEDFSRSTNKPSHHHGSSTSEQSRKMGLRNLIEELAIELSHSQYPSQAGQVVTRHVQACDNVVGHRSSFRSPPRLPESPCLSPNLEEPSLKAPGTQLNRSPIEDVVTHVETVDTEDSESSASSSSVVVSTQYSAEHTNGSNHNDISRDEVADETGPPSFDLLSPLFLPLSSSPATVKTEPFSRVESPILLPSPLPASQRFAATCAEAFAKENGAGFENPYHNRDSLIEAMCMTSVSEKAAHEVPRSPAVSENSQPTTYQSISVVEDYDSDKMIVSMRTVKSDKSMAKKRDKPNSDTDEDLDRSAKNASHESLEKTACALQNLDEFDSKDSEEPIDEEAVIVNLDVEQEKSGHKDAKNDQEARSHDQRLTSSESGGLRTSFFQNRQRSSVNFTKLEDGQYSTIVRSNDLHPNRQHKLIPLQTVGRSQSSAEKPINDWPEITPYEADKESRLSRRHLSDLSFGVKERQKDMLPRELIPDDFPSDDDESQQQEPAMERFGARGWKKGLVLACKDVSECRRLVRNFWRRRKRGAPIEEGLRSATGMYRTDSHRGSQIRRNMPQEMAVKFDSELSQDTVFILLVRHCPECGVTVVARRPNHKLKITVPIPDQTRPLLLSIHLTKKSHTRGTTVILARSRDDQSGAARKHIELTGHALRRKLEEHLEYIEDSFSSSLLDESSRFC
ncbi:hypothetical protein BWQ96_06691 [Gracilariopsis chorda]|uniref:Uncharacterized protein n=1 Tax=Gracilariopsis chorda TaxID=448386 RepID=A0A2V3INF1_9FLOR|nr:hypothetical protein BWQ96_06691 [Gracilariopsis chorda]|eukprot:PXF43579.1 hypothetical protein BWQ96_06691 [Gracilariopsis chorda]